MSVDGDVTPRETAGMYRSGISSSLSPTKGVPMVHVLLQPGDTDSAMTVSWIEVPRGAARTPQQHARAEEVLVVVSGAGRVRVGDEVADVRTGGLVHVPANTRYDVENTGDGSLTYVTAATPAYAITDDNEMAAIFGPRA
jgi:mannose-6-phosphate isomerase-like protein (cupin superfamily)